LSRPSEKFGTHSTSFIRAGDRDRAGKGSDSI
jgi:hypothetical protein